MIEEAETELQARASHFLSIRPKPCIIIPQVSPTTNLHPLQEGDGKGFL